MKRRLIHPGAVLVSLALAGCAPSTQLSQNIPTLEEVRPTTRPAIPPATQGSVQAVSAGSWRIDLPLAGSLDKAWALTEPIPDDEAMVELWEANGLRAALLDATHFEKFTAALPEKLGVEAQRIIVSNDPIALPLSAPLTRPTNFLLTTSDNLAIQKLPRGTPQFLLSLQREGDAVVTQLIPHHFFRQTHVAPQTPLEAALDGRLFHDLALRVALRKGRLLVVAWERPAQPAATQPDTQPATQPAPPPRLGDLLLTAARFGHPTQRVLVIGLAGE